MNARRVSFAVVGVLVVLMGARPVRAQVPGPQLEARAFEIGMGIHFIDRELDALLADHRYHPKFHLTAASFRYGVNERLTITGEVAAANSHALEEFFNESNLNGRYLLGGVGAQAAVVLRDTWKVNMGLHTTRSAWVLRETGADNETTTTSVWALICERTFEFGSQAVVLWAGPSYESYTSDVYSRRVRGSVFSWKSTHNWGATAGFNALWFSRVDTYAHVLYAEHFQPRVGIAVRFE